jgi:hypothetical protein
MAYRSLEDRHAAGRRNAAKSREFVRQQKDRPCLDCGGQYPHYMMDFDHRDPTTKEFNVGNGTGRSEQTLLAEIAKCDLVCANCHRERTHGNRRGSNVR